VGQLRKLPAAERLAMRHTAVDGPMPTCFAILPRWINTITWIHANLQLPFHFIVIIVFWGMFLLFFFFFLILCNRLTFVSLY
jgi:hypothetical protein